MGNIVVEIQVKQGTGTLGEADFWYSPSTFICTRGDVIQWKCPQGPFALHFGERPLLGKIVIRSQVAAGCHETAPLTVGFRVDAAGVTKIPPGVIQQGMHKYSVAVQLEQAVGDLRPGVYLDASPGGGYEC